MRIPFARVWNRLLPAGLGLALLLPATAAPPRVAVLARTPALDAAADLLSLRPDLAVVERAEIRRMLQEQTLLAHTGAQVARIGRLLGADGLVFLEIPAVPQKASPARLSARLVAVRPGVVLTELTDAWPAPDLAQWAAGAVERFAPFLPKLAVREADAVPLSILNLRHATAVAGRELEERALTRLLAGRLMREKALFVLERRRMESLTFEKELLSEGTNSCNAPFS